MKNQPMISTSIIAIIAFIGLITITLSCENPNPLFGLPRITTEGKGTFGYRVNGEIQGQCYDGFFTSVAKAEIVGDSMFTLGESCKGHSFGFFLRYNVLNIDRKYLIDSTSGVSYSGESGKSYRATDPNSEFYVEFLKFDQQAKIISGTFSGYLYNEDGESVTISDGRFDQIYREF